MELDAKIEGLLFYKGEETSIDTLSKLLSCSTEEIEKSILILKDKLINRGIVLVRNKDNVVLGITSELSSIIESIRKEELNKELSKASLETLSIIMYKDGVTRSEIDYIRGVNSSFIVRNLLVRGLIQRSTDKSDTRRVLYYPSIETLQYMNVTSVFELPDYENIKTQLQNSITGKQND